MRILNRYLVVDYLITFGMTLMVFTFVMYIGALIKAIDLLSRGVSAAVIFQIFFYNIPYILSFSIPMSAITTVLLLFGRLSIDGEITAMKACGLSLWQVVSPVLLLSVGLSFLCLYLNFYSAPNSHFARRMAMVNVGEIDPMALLEEGRFSYDFPGYHIRIGRKVSDTEVYDVHIYEMGPNGIRRYIRAENGTMVADRENLRLNVDLYNVQIEERDPDHPEKTTLFPTSKYSFNPDYQAIMRNKNISKKLKDVTFPELLGAIRDVDTLYDGLSEDRRRERTMECMVEFHRRVAFAVCCFSFTLLGIPLGMKSKRRESSVGIGVSLLIVFFFYFFIVIAQSLTKHPEFYPDLIVWIPVFASQVAGTFLMQRSV